MDATAVEWEENQTSSSNRSSVSGDLFIRLLRTMESLIHPNFGWEYDSPYPTTNKSIQSTHLLRWIPSLPLPDGNCDMPLATWSQTEIYSIKSFTFNCLVIFSVNVIVGWLLRSIKCWVSVRPHLKPFPRSAMEQHSPVSSWFRYLNS